MDNHSRMIVLRAPCGGYECETRTIGSFNGKRGTRRPGKMTHAKRRGVKLARRTMKRDVQEQCCEYISTVNAHRDERGRFQPYRNIILV